MQNRQKTRVYLWANAAILAVLISFRVCTYFSNTDLCSLNYSNIKRIQGLSKNKEDITFAVIGNIKSSVEVFDKRIIKTIKDDDIDFVISAGNAVVDGSNNKYRVLNKSINKLGVPFVMAIGEGEVSGEGAFRFYEYFGPLYFSFGAGDSYYIFIDATEKTSMSWQKEWLIRELEEGNKYKNKFVFISKSPYKPNQIDYPVHNNLYISDAAYSKFLMDSFTKYKVNGVFSSSIGVYHEEIINEVPYYITGGGGGPLVLGNQNSFYHYVKVKPSLDKVECQVKKIGKGEEKGLKSVLSSKAAYFYSLFKINFINFLIGLFVLSLAILFIYKKVIGEVDYYRDFDYSEDDDYQGEKLNIAMFTNNYFPFVGGVPISIERLSRGLRKQGHKVYIFAPEYPQKWEDDEDSVVRCKLITYYETNQFDFPIVNVFLPEIEKEFSMRNIDILHIHHPFGIGHKGLKLARKYNIPTVLTYHTRYEKYVHNLPVGGKLFKSKIPHKIIRKFAQRCSTIIAPTGSAKEYLEHIGVTRPIEVLPTGIEFEQYENINMERVKEIKKKYVENEVLLCSVSRLTKEKNLYFLIDGIKYIREKTKKDVRCIIIGDGPEKQKLQQVIDDYNLQDTILLIGKVEPREIAFYYRASDIFVFASRSETQGMVLLEAMAGMCPVVAVRSSGTDDMIIDGENGYKTKANIKEWGEKVIELVEDEDLRVKTGKNAYDFSKGFSIEEMAKKASRVYHKTIREQENALSIRKSLD
ncbi:MAG: glycosyltransferase [Epulopiscium sp.]|nr:glycosyltransferase [Candidatus Epulonipiscium sp.]